MFEIKINTTETKNGSLKLSGNPAGNSSWFRFEIVEIGQIRHVGMCFLPKFDNPKTSSQGLKMLIRKKSTSDQLRVLTPGFLGDKVPITGFCPISFVYHQAKSCNISNETNFFCRKSLHDKRG